MFFDILMKTSPGIDFEIKGNEEFVCVYMYVEEANLLFEKNCINRLIICLKTVFMKWNKARFTIKKSFELLKKITIFGFQILQKSLLASEILEEIKLGYEWPT